jgi:hypothetical protein
MDGKVGGGRTSVDAGAAIPGGPVSAFQGSAMSRPALMMVRLKPGVVGQRLRVVHLVPLSGGEDIPVLLTAYCGAEIAVRSAELILEPSGMPCEACLATVPLPADDAPDPLPQWHGTTAPPARTGQQVPSEASPMRVALNRRGSRRFTRQACSWLVATVPVAGSGFHSGQPSGYGANQPREDGWCT